MKDCNDIIIDDTLINNDIIIDDTILNTQVFIDDSTPNLNAFYTLINKFSSSIESLNYIESLTAKWIETADEMDTYVQPLTSKWIETAIEMDTLQEAPTGNWQGVYEYIEKGVIDAGFF